MNKRKVIMTLGDRGGTGKTTVAKLLWEWQRVRPDARAYDADGTTGAFAQVYASYDKDGAIVTPQPAKGVTPVLLHAEDREGRDAALGTILATDASVVLVDMPATSLTVLERVEEDWSLFGVLHEHGFEVVTVNVVTPFKSSLQNVLRTMRLAPTAVPVVVLNEAFGKRDAFFLWDGEAGAPTKGKALLAERGGVEIVLPALPMRQAILVDAADASFGAAVREVGTSVDRGYVERWLLKCRSAFAPAASILELDRAPERAEATA